MKKQITSSQKPKIEIALSKNEKKSFLKNLGDEIASALENKDGDCFKPLEINVKFGKATADLKLNEEGALAAFAFIKKFIKN